MSTTTATARLAAIAAGNDVHDRAERLHREHRDVFASVAEAARFVRDSEAESLSPDAQAMVQAQAELLRQSKQFEERREAIATWDARLNNLRNAAARSERHLEQQSAWLAELVAHTDEVFAEDFRNNIVGNPTVSLGFAVGRMRDHLARPRLAEFIRTIEIPRLKREVEEAQAALAAHLESTP